MNKYRRGIYLRIEIANNEINPIKIAPVILITCKENENLDLINYDFLLKILFFLISMKTVRLI